MLQFIHRNVGIKKGLKKTFVFETPEADAFLIVARHKMSGSNFPVFIKMGIAHVHKKDNYKKSTGRDLAVERSRCREFYITKIGFGENGFIDMDLVEVSDKITLKVGLRAGKPHARVLDIRLDSD